MTALHEIENQTRAYADARRELAERIEHCTQEVREVKRRHYRKLKAAADKVGQLRAVLHHEIARSSECFDKPRTRLFHGVRVGLTKGKGRLHYDDDARVVQLIERKLPDQFEVLVKTTQKPIKNALAGLSADDLSRIGVTVEDAGDEVVIKDAKSDIEKFVDAFMNDDDIADVTGEEAA
ncbi:MAG: hypothetical protein AAF354_10135 [Pseudomonadota bacterium]